MTSHSGDSNSLDLIPLMAALAAAISLLERSPKSGAPSDKMFDAMLNDYRRALNNARNRFACSTEDATGKDVTSNEKNLDGSGGPAYK